ncbi:hypothetical protein HQ587_01000 [bacterium]|nr:hypothetical protein [bacterium]
MKENEPVIRLNVLDLLLLITKWRKLFIINFLLVAIAAVVIAFLLPKWYSATTVLLSPGGGMGGLPSFLPSELKGVAMSFGMEMASEEIYQTILGSRTLKEHIIERFGLRKVYKMTEKAFPEDVIDAFNEHLFVETLDDGSIAVTVEDRNPELAAEMANACVEELDRIYSKITRETASSNKKFIGRRLEQVNASLTTLQDSIMRFQQDTRAISIPEQVQVMISTAADLKAEMLANEIKLEVMRSSLGVEHPAVTQLVVANRELTRNYNRVFSGSEGGLFLGFSQLPEITREYAELMREMKIQSTLLEYIYPQYENARIQEQRETANVQVLDPARVPNKKSRPPRKMIVIISTFMSVFVTLVVVLLFEYWNTLPARNQEDWKKIRKITGFFRRRSRRGRDC